MKKSPSLGTLSQSRFERRQWETTPFTDSIKPEAEDLPELELPFWSPSARPAEADLGDFLTEALDALARQEGKA